MASPQKKQPDQKRIVAHLARDLHYPVDEVAVLYEQQRAELAVTAHIAAFVHIFASRNIETILRQRSVDRQTMALSGGIVSDG